MSIPAPAISGPAAHEQARAEAIGERAEPRRQREHDQALGQQRQPDSQRRVAGYLLQIEDEEEEQRRQAAVERQRLDVPDREVSALEQVQPQHRVARARFVEEERGEQEHAADQRAAHRQASTSRAAAARSARTPFRRDPARTARRRRHPPCAGGGGAASTGPPLAISHRQRDHQRQIDDEDPAPRGDVQDHSGDERAERPGDRSPCRPRPDRGPRSRSGKVATITASELGVSSAPAIPCNARNATSNADRWRDRAQQRRGAEAAHAEREHPPLPEDVAQRAAEQDQRAERQQVRVADPLLTGQPPAEAASLSAKPTPEASGVSCP